MNTVTEVKSKKTRKSLRPRFFGLVGGELFKATRMWSTWITFILLLGIISFPYLISFTTDIQMRIQADALSFYYNEMQQNLFVVRVFIGFFLIFLTANIFGREYQLGTIRLLIAAGVGRVQLFLAKLLTVVLIAAAVLICCLLLNIGLLALLVDIKMGNLNSLQVLNSAFWHNTELYLLTVLISMGVTILMATTMGAIGRSLTFGLSIALIWFPADNIGTLFLMLARRLTNNDFWPNVSAYLLGPNINAMPTVLLPSQLTATVHPESPSFLPLVSVDSTHTLLVALSYSLIFIILSLFLTGKRDVKE